MKICSKCGNVNETNVCKYCGNVDEEKKVVKQTNTISAKEEKVFNRLYDFYFLYYLIFSSISLICYLVHFNIICIISTVILLLGVFIERILGISRNYFGFIGILAGGILGYIFINNDILLGPAVGISIVLFIVGLIQFIIGHLFGFLFSKLG